MKRASLAGLLAPALLCAAAASQTIVVVRPLPFTGAPRILPSPLAGLPLPSARLPAPMNLPLTALTLAPLPVLAPSAAPAAASAALPAVAMNARAELPPAVRALLPLSARLERKSPAPAARPAKEEPLFAAFFDGRRVTVPEDDLERELGLK
jgi:hypothetical protein